MTRMRPTPAGAAVVADDQARPLTGSSMLALAECQNDGMRLRCRLLSIIATFQLAACASAASTPPVTSALGTSSATPAVTSTLTQLEARPLRLPAIAQEDSCPATPGEPASSFSPFGTGFTPGTGPLYPDLGTTPIGANVAWKVLWFAAPSYAGPAIVRGRELRGAAAVRFGVSANATTLLVLDSPAGADAGTGLWRNWPTYTFLSMGGCYAYQVDGVGLTETIVFIAR